MKMPGGRSGILSLSIKDKAVLYSAYMPFITNGGLFIPTDKQYKLGEEIFLLLNIMDESDKIPVAGKVVWITPKGAQGVACCVSRVAYLFYNACVFNLGVSHACYPFCGFPLPSGSLES